MKKSIGIISLIVIALAQTAISQDITLKFTGAKTDGSFVRLDSVQVFNLSRLWSETVVYPDTVLTFQITGISTAQNDVADIKAYPNPFKGSTNVAITIPQSGNATLQVFNLAGQKVTEKTMSLEAGKSIFDVRLKNPQIYLLSVITPQGHSTIKLINRSSAGENSILSRGTIQTFEKRQSTQSFQIGDVLRIIGYATDNTSVVSSREVMQSQSSSENFVLLFDPSIPAGALSGVFTVSSNRQVRFSKGNLQWSATGGGSTPTTHAVAGGGTSVGTWRFAPNQWDIIGADNRNIDSAYSGWIDLFGWGTSGYHNPDDTRNKHYQPYSDSFIGGGYGPSGYRSYWDSNLVGTSANYDWGVYNAISNGGNIPDMWRSLTAPEMDTLLNYRNTTSGIRFAYATVNGISGIIIVPDDWNPSIYTLDSANYLCVAYTNNLISLSDWSLLENAGCVFLPAAGNREFKTVTLVNQDGFYWHSSYSYMRDDDYRLCWSQLRFMKYSWELRPGHSWNEPDFADEHFLYSSNGHSVRLVKDTATAVLPSVTTTAVSNIRTNRAVGGGNVTSDGGTSIRARGICWSTSHNPTINDNHTINGSGTGAFTSDITGLTIDTTYYVRAYVTNSVGTVYGNEVSFTASYPTGALHSVFSVGTNKRVHFSKGNLQWSATGGGSTATTHTVATGGTAAGTWRFAPNQLDTIGSANSNISSSYTGWIDLFGWGTSGYNNKHPYMTSTNERDYDNGNNDIANTNYDWGIYNAISNGGNQPRLWHTLTKDEWDTLLYYRNTTSGVRYARAAVNGLAGLIVVPDNWDTNTYTLDSANIDTVTCASNIISSANWSVLDSLGCLFLPEAGIRYDGNRFYGTYGGYWSSTSYNSYYSHNYVWLLYFYYIYREGVVMLDFEDIKHTGYSVRLVTDE